MDDHARWQPWLDALHLHATPEAKPSDDDITRGTIWIYWACEVDGDKGHESVEMATQALELLAILAETQQSLWRLLVARVWPQVVSLWSDVDESRQFRLGVDLYTDKIGVLGNNCTRFLLDDLDGVVTKSYEALRTELESAHVNVALLRKIPIRLVFDEDMDIEVEAVRQLRDRFPDMLFEAVEVTWPQHEQDYKLPTAAQATGKWAKLFRIHEVEITGTHGFHSGPLFFVLFTLATMRVRLRHLRLDMGDVSTSNAELYVPSLLFMLAANEAVQPSDFVMEAVDSVGLDQFPSRQTHESIFSALLTSRTIRKISIGALDYILKNEGMRPPNGERLWQWIAVVFSGHFRSQLDEFALWAGKLTDADVRVFEKALRNPDPLSLLYPSKSRSRVRAMQATVTASIFQLHPPSRQKRTKKQVNKKKKKDGGNLYMLDFDLPLRNLRIIDADDTWLSVVLPGWGKAWVKRSNAQVVKLPEETCSSSEVKTSPVRHFKIDAVSEQRKDVVLDLLGLVGGGLQALTLTSKVPNEPTRDNWIRQVFGVCSRLEEFTSKYIPLTSLESIAWCYEERSCRVEKLSIAVSPLSGLAYANHFFEYLADEDHIMTQYVRDLKLKLHIRPLQDLAPALESALDMLDHNLRIYRTSRFT